MDAAQQAQDAAASPVGDAAVIPVGGDGGILYNPCLANNPCRFMPLGDSITEGYEGGYRIPLFRATNAGNKSITFVGTQANGPATVDGLPFSRLHEGHSGYYIDSTHANYNIADLVDAAIASQQPNIIALQIGTNDVARSNLPNSPERLGLLLDQISADAPNALIVLAQITPTQDDATNQLVQTYNAAMPALVSSRVAQGKHIALVDMYSAFVADPSYKTTLMYDNLHPGDAGNVVLANVWYSAISAVLPAK